MELLKDYDCEIHFPPRIFNVVANALIRKEKLIQITSERMGIVSQLLDLIRKDQKVAERLVNLKQEDMVNYINQLSENSQGVKTFMMRIWVIKYGHARKLIIHDAHCTLYTVHPGSTKMNWNFKKMYCGPR